MLIRLLSLAFAGMTATAQTASPNTLKLNSVSPTGSIPGVVRILRVNGEKLNQLKGLRIKLQNDKVDLTSVSATETVATYELVVRQDQRIGQYKIEMTVDGSTWSDSGLVYSITPVNQFYIDCPLRVGDEVQNAESVGISCSQALLDRKESSDIFGKRIAHMYLAVQVNLRNLSRDFDFVLQDVRLVIDDGVSVASRTRPLVRAVAEKGQVLDGRNIMIAAVTAVGSVAGGLAASSLFTKDFARATNLFQGPFRSALTGAFPDFTVAQLNRINDHSLSSEGMIIPKDAPAMVVAFASQRIFLSQAERDQFIQRRTIRKQDRPALLRFQNRIRVLIAGSHVERINLNQPTLTSISPSTGLQGSTHDLTLTGTNLDKVSKIRLRKGPGTAGNDADIKVGENNRQATAKVTLSALAPDIYNVYLVGPSGSESPTSATFTIDEALPKLTAASPSAISKGAQAVEITFSVDRVDLVRKILALQNGSVDSGVSVTNLTPDAAGAIKAAVTAAAAAKDGEHVWYLETAKGHQIASAVKFSVSAPEPAPVLLRVTLGAVKAGDPVKSVTLEGERLDKVMVVALFQNGAKDDAVQVAIDSKTATKIEVKLTAGAAALTGAHRWTLDAVESKQVLDVTK